MNNVSINSDLSEISLEDINDFSDTTPYQIEYSTPNENFYARYFWMMKKECYASHSSANSYARGLMDKMESQYNMETPTITSTNTMLTETPRILAQKTNQLDANGQTDQTVRYSSDNKKSKENNYRFRSRSGTRVRRHQRVQTSRHHRSTLETAQDENMLSLVSKHDYKQLSRRDYYSRRSSSSSHRLESSSYRRRSRSNRYTSLRSTSSSRKPSKIRSTYEDDLRRYKKVRLSLDEQEHHSKPASQILASKKASRRETGVVKVERDSSNASSNEENPLKKDATQKTGRNSLQSSSNIQNVTTTKPSTTLTTEASSLLKIKSEKVSDDTKNKLADVAKLDNNMSPKVMLRRLKVEPLKNRLKKQTIASGSENYKVRHKRGKLRITKNEETRNSKSSELGHQTIKTSEKSEVLINTNVYVNFSKDSSQQTIASNSDFCGQTEVCSSDFGGQTEISRSDFGGQTEVASCDFGGQTEVNSSEFGAQTEVSSKDFGGQTKVSSEYLEKQEEQNSLLRHAAYEYEGALREQDQQIVTLQKMIADQSHAAYEYEDALREQDQKIATLQKITADQGQAKYEYEDAMREQDQKIATLQKMIADQGHEYEGALREQDQKIVTLQKMIADQGHEYEGALREQDQQIATLQKMIADQGQMITEHDEKIENYVEEIKSLSEELDDAKKNHCEVELINTMSSECTERVNEPLDLSTTNDVNRFSVEIYRTNAHSPSIQSDATSSLAQYSSSAPTQRPILEDRVWNPAFTPDQKLSSASTSPILPNSCPALSFQPWI